MGVSAFHWLHKAGLGLGQASVPLCGLQVCGIKGYAHVGTYVRAAHTSWVVYLTIHQVEGSLVLDIRESRNIWCLLLHILYLGWVIYFTVRE